MKRDKKKIIAWVIAAPLVVLASPILAVYFLAACVGVGVEWVFEYL